MRIHSSPELGARSRMHCVSRLQRCLGNGIHDLGMLNPQSREHLVVAAQSLVVVADLTDVGERSRVFRSRTRDELTTLRRGPHLPTEVWRELPREDQHRLRCLSSSDVLAPGEAISHRSAALLRGLPLVGGWPTRVETTVLVESGLTSTAALRRHRRVERPSVEQLFGLPVTSEAQTVVDVATSSPFASAVVVADAALWRAARARQEIGVRQLHDELDAHVQHLGAARGSARARRVVDVADHRADRPGESLSRVAMIELGADLPELQYEVVGLSGRHYWVDFGWPELGIVAEFDGKAKYSDPEFLRGRTAEQAVYDEKLREDDIRPMVTGFGRWDWTIARSLELMAHRLHAIGVPMRSRHATVLLSAM